MSQTDDHPVGSRSGVELILIGLLLALLGAASVMLMVTGLSLVYVGRYALGGALLVGFFLCGGVFIACYGRYINRLERRNAAPSAPPPLPPQTPTIIESHPETRLSSVAPRVMDHASSQPAPASQIIALAAGAYGLLIAAAGLFWTRGLHLTYNLVAAGALLICVVVVWRAGKRKVSS